MSRDAPASARPWNSTFRCRVQSAWENQPVGKQLLMALFPDPRVFVDAAATAEDAHCYSLAQASLTAATGSESMQVDRRLAALLSEYLAGDGTALARVVSGAPSVDVHRHLVRVLASFTAAQASGADALALTLFAIPVVLVAGVQGDASARALLSGVIPDARGLADILREHGALGGNRTTVLAEALASADAIDLARLPDLRMRARLPASGAVAVSPLALTPSPLAVAGGVEAAHLRFVVGTALAAPGVDLLGEPTVGRWGMPFAQALSKQLSAPGVSLLAIPRPAQALVTAGAVGRAAQRDVSAQLFASNAIRRLRASFGEPVAVISAHRVGSAGGEVRLSLSTPFDPREAEGLRCPLYPFDRPSDVVTMLTDLLHDCRVADIRVLAGVHPDREPKTGLPLLFKPETIPATLATPLH